MTEQHWTTAHSCADCGRRYIPADDAHHDPESHRAYHLTYEANATTRCYPCHLGLPHDTCSGVPDT